MDVGIRSRRLTVSFVSTSQCPLLTCWSWHRQILAFQSNISFCVLSTSTLCTTDKKNSYANPEAPCTTFRWPDRRAPSLDHRCSAVSSMRTRRQLFRRRRAWCVGNSPTRHRPDCKFFAFLLLLISFSSERKNPQLIGLLRKTKGKIIKAGDPNIVYFSRSLFLLFFFHFISSY